MEKTTNYSSQINSLEILTLIFITLKLLGKITWSWVWVLSPIWITIGIVIIIVVIMIIIASINGEI